MKILNIENDPITKNEKPSDTDLLGVLVEYEGGATGIVYMHRARYNRISYQQRLMDKYGISNGDMKVLEELFADEYRAEHFYDD